MSEKRINMDEQKQLAIEELTRVKDPKTLEIWFKDTLGKNGWVSQLNRTLKDYPVEERANTGARIQELKQFLETEYKIKHELLAGSEDYRQWDFGAIGATQTGSVHPLSYITKKALDLFARKGFIRLEGSDIETEYYNFEALNTVEMHPSRSDSDTFYMSKDGLLLRTQVTAIQARALEQAQKEGKLPFYGIAAGNVYRRDDDATHSPMFSQLEGIVVDENITAHNLKGWILSFVKELLPEIEEIRLRPSFFPFTYMSAEVDAKFKGKGGWLEIMGCGMIHPEILKRANIDSEKYRGLAFGMGLERLTMLVYGLTDLRDLYNNDTRFLDTFKHLNY